MRLSRIFRPEDGIPIEEAVPLRRTLFWVLAWAVIIVGIVLFFRYARYLTPLLD